MKRLIQQTLGHFGFELRRIEPPPSIIPTEPVPAFHPCLEFVSLAGVTFEFLVGDPTGKEWYNPEDHRGFVEHIETARLIQRGDRVLEIGTHHGFYAMLLSKLVGDDGFVLGVEPAPFNAMMAMAQVGLNRAANLRILQAAASVHSGSIRISRDSNAAVTDSAQGIEVPAVTVDELDSRFGPFNVLKVDVEGFEQFVLAGASRLLSRHPKLLLELHPFGPSKREEVLALLATSYAGTFVTREERGTVHAFPDETLPNNDIVNLFLAHRPG